MSVTLIVLVAGLSAVGVYLVTSRVLSRIVLGFALLGHAAVLALLTAGGPAGEPPLADTEATDLSNPLPQALALTAIVISFGLTIFLLALSRRQQELTGDDLVEDDIEDRRITEAFDEDVAEHHVPRFDPRDVTPPVELGIDEQVEPAGGQDRPAYDVPGTTVTDVSIGGSADDPDTNPSEPGERS